MFDNIGRKIMPLAQVVCWIGIVGCVITGTVLLFIDEDLVLTGILLAVFGSLLSWIGSFFLYGFGQLIDNTDTIVGQNRLLIKNGSQKEQPAQSDRMNAAEYSAAPTPGPQSNAAFDSAAPTLGPQAKAADESASGDAVEVEVVDNLIICPACGFRQLPSRTRCWKCGMKFIKK